MYSRWKVSAEASEVAGHHEFLLGPLRTVEQQDSVSADSSSTEVVDTRVNENDDLEKDPEDEREEEVVGAVGDVSEGAKRGGLVVQYEQLRGFIPASHLGRPLNRDNMADYVGQKLPALSLEVD
uniref:S1 motif domain-containing protein n=1 Tax=Tetradesmus obliquus TaxID=3088 RepID=A0A383V7Z4_TETOB|eukprot:jgi/Sobl393_1/6889/SZX61705.1